MADVGVFLWLVINILTGVFISLRNSVLGLLPNLALATFTLLYVVPLFVETDISVQLLSAILLSNALLSAVFVLMSAGRKKNSRGFPDGSDGRAAFKLGDVAISLAVVFVIVGNAATFYSLVNSGGLLAVISDFGGRGYLNVRVNSASSGILGVLAWSSPFGLAVLYATALTRRRFRYWVLFLGFFLLTATGYALLTVRHNMVATLIMLLLIHLVIRKVSPTLLVIFSALAVTVIVFFQSLRVSGLQGLAISTAVNTIFASNEHIKVTESVINTVNRSDYLYFAHALDVFTFAIPRALWAGKPETSTLNRVFFPDVAAVGSEKAIGLVAEGYASLGLLGVVALSAAFALLISRLQRALNQGGMSVRATLLAVALVPISYIGVRTGFLGKHLITFVLVYLQYRMITGLGKKRLVFGPTRKILAIRRSP